MGVDHHVVAHRAQGCRSAGRHGDAVADPGHVENYLAPGRAVDEHSAQPADHAVTGVTPRLTIEYERQFVTLGQPTPTRGMVRRAAPCRSLEIAIRDRQPSAP